jgi:hypothetical protein
MVWLYGYLSRIRSSRKLERTGRENMGLIWLARGHTLDHNSVWRFLDGSRQAISQLFTHSVKVAVKCAMVGMAVRAIDGAKIESASSWDKMRSAEDLEKMQGKLDRSVVDFMTGLAGKFKKMGCTIAKVLEGGVEAWKQAGYKLV